MARTVPGTFDVCDRGHAIGSHPSTLLEYDRRGLLTYARHWRRLALALAFGYRVTSAPTSEKVKQRVGFDFTS